MKTKQTNRRRLWTGAIAVGAVMALTATPVMAETTPTQTATVDLGDLDASGSGAFDGFDTSLGTLTQVDIAVETTMDFDVCIHNRSSEADSVPTGEVTGSAPITFPADVVSNATGSMAIEGATLEASDGTDDCMEWLENGTPVDSPDSILLSDTDVSNFSETVTAAADLAEYEGGADAVEFSYEASSDSSIGQPSEWTIIFLASGAADLSIFYTYDPATEVTGEPLISGIAESVCDADAAYLEYEATTENVDSDTITIHWFDADGVEQHTDVVDGLSGRVLWPGAEVDDEGFATDWPGFVFDGEVWEEGDDGFAWAHGDVTVTLEVNPTTDPLAVSYPAATNAASGEDCLPPDIEVAGEQFEQPAADDLPRTGQDTLRMVLWAALLTGLGAMILLATDHLSRMRRTRS